MKELKNFYPNIEEGDATTDLAKKAGRFVMFKVSLTSKSHSLTSIITNLDLIEMNFRLRIRAFKLLEKFGDYFG